MSWWPSTPGTLRESNFDGIDRVQGHKTLWHSNCGWMACWGRARQFNNWSCNSQGRLTSSSCCAIWLLWLRILPSSERCVLDSVSRRSSQLFSFSAMIRRRTWTSLSLRIPDILWTCSVFSKTASISSSAWLIALERRVTPSCRLRLPWHRPCSAPEKFVRTVF